MSDMSEPDGPLEETKWRAQFVALIMEAFGPDYERAAEQLTDRIMKSTLAYRAGAVEVRDLASFATFREYQDSVFRAGFNAINECVGRTLGLVKQARRGRE